MQQPAQGDALLPGYGEGTGRVQAMPVQDARCGSVRALLGRARGHFLHHVQSVSAGERSQRTEDLCGGQQRVFQVYPEVAKSRSEFERCFSNNLRKILFGLMLLSKLN